MGTEQVQIRHEQVVTHQPGVCFIPPDLGEGGLNFDLANPRHPIFRVYGDKKEIGSSNEDMCTAGGCLSSNVAVGALSLCHDGTLEHKGLK